MGVAHPVGCHGARVLGGKAVVVSPSLAHGAGHPRRMALKRMNQIEFESHRGVEMLRHATCGGCALWLPLLRGTCS